MDPQKSWMKILNEIKPEVGPANFRAWFSQIDALQIKDQKIVLSVPSAFIESQLKARYFNLISSSLEKVLGEVLQIEFRINPSKLSKNSTLPDGFFDLTTQSSTQNYLNPKYTLENFVVGLSNNVAFAGAQAVVQNPGTSYNPLFLYGGTGVGKTHLMIGVGNALFSKNPSLKIIYCSSEKFMNDYVSAIQEHKMGEFRAKYRSTDVLLIDDIQFFSGREGTQEEFFHTFNELQSKNSQMILTSDRIPNEIAKLEDRLKSRFQGGLMVDIQPPDLDTRVAILRAKCQEKGDIVPEEALKLLASTLETNIRELEGRMMQIMQNLKAQNLPPTVENIAQFLQNTPKHSIQFDYKKLISTVCSYFDLNQKDLTSPKRQKELVLPRHIIMYILCEELGMTVERVGQILGGRDHTTVMHGRDKIKKLLITDRELQTVFIEIKQKIQN